MIEALKNCPNCGGTLNEAGRCEFCGSKVYDFLSVDFTGEPHYQTAKTYIRIKMDGKIVLAPILIDNVSMTSKPCYSGYEDYYTGQILNKIVRTETTMDIHCQVIDNMYLIEDVV